MNAMTAKPLRERPAFLARIAGLPLDTVRRLAFPRLTAILDDIESNRRRRIAISAEISKSTHQVIPTLSKQCRRRVLKVRRDVHADRLSCAVGIRELVNQVTHLDSRLVGELEEWVELAERELQLEREFDLEFENAICETDRSLRQLVADTDFGKALQLLSPRIYRSINKPESHLTWKLRGRLYSYATRAALKPTPLSYLASMAQGRWTLGEETPQTAIEGSGVTSTCRLAQVIPAAILATLPRLCATAPYLKVRRNPIAESASDSIVFLAPGNFLHGRRERFVRVPRTSVDALIQVFDDCNEDVTYAEVFDRLNRNIDCGETTSRTLKTLVEHGVLSIHSPIDDRDPMLVATLARQLSAIESAPAHHVANCLNMLHETQHEFEAGDQRARQDRLVDAVTTLERLGAELPEAKKFVSSIEPVFYEDTIRPDCEVVVSAPRFDHAILGLRTFSWVLGLFDPQPLLHMARAEILDRHSTTTMSLLDYFRVWYQQQNSVRFERQIWELPSEDGLFFDAVTEIKSLQRELLEFLGPREDSAEVRFDSADARLLSIQSRASELLVNWGRIAHFCQTLPDVNGLGWNNAGLGFGKHFARFSMAMKQVGATPFSIKPGCSGDPHINCDIGGVFGTNVNLRDDVVGSEIGYPGVTSIRPGIDRVHPDDIIVRRLSHAPWISLEHKARKRPIRVVPIGMLFPLNAPPFYRFLCGFAPTMGSRLSVWERHAQLKRHSRDEEILRFPRLWINSAVIERATWRVSPKGLHECIRIAKSKMGLYRSIMDWHRDLGLPRQTFVTLLESPDFFSRHQYQDDRSKRWFQGVQHPWLRKPFFVDFDSPISVLEFARRVPHDLAVLTFKEWLPREEGSFAIDGRRCVELVIEQELWQS